MQSLTTRDLDRLTKLCGMFSSHHPGEIANAAAMADRLLREHGLRWTDVLALPTAPVPTPADDGPTVFAGWPGGWRAACRFALRYRAMLTDWECEFAQKIDRYVGNITGKQEPILREMVERLLAAGYRP
ncbi:MAG TPA: hypothetical protein VFQ90_19985 [Stellaceae bacterium]|jgi:hypothetical protein|nr:hypothetical protein [Stellaceae bacterium]